MSVLDLGMEAQRIADAITLALPPNQVCVIDERDLNIPGALLQLDSGTFNRLDKQTLETTWRVWLIERDAGNLSALTRLGEMLAALQAEAAAIGDWRAEAISLPNHSADLLPAITFEITTES